MLDPGRISAAENDRHHVQFNLSNQIGRRSSDFSYYDVMDYGNRVKQTAETSAKFRSWSGPLTAETDLLQVHDDDDSGYCSPPLWRTSPSASPQHRRNHYRNLSPASKAQAIARGQRELMEMVSKMPESCYELSLKDLVEQQQQPAIEVKQKDGFKEEKCGKSQELYKRERRTRNNTNDRRMEIVKRNGNMGNNKEGFLLKMVLPVGFGSKHKKKSDLASSNSFIKIIPKSPTPDGSEKGVDKEWWKKRYSVQNERESSGSSSNNGSVKSSSVSSSNSSSSSSSSRSITRPENPGCLSFIIRTKNSKNVE